MSVSDWSGATLPWVEDLSDLKERIGDLFRRAEPRRQVGLLLEGLIGGAERKNGWQLAETPATRRHGECRRFSAERYGIRKRPATFVAIM